MDKRRWGEGGCRNDEVFVIASNDENAPSYKLGLVTNVVPVPDDDGDGVDASESCIGECKRRIARDCSAR